MFASWGPAPIYTKSSPTQLFSSSQFIYRFSQQQSSETSLFSPTFGMGRIERTRTDRSEKLCPIDLVYPPDRDINSSTFVSDCLAFNIERQIETLKCTTELIWKSIKDSTEQLDALKSLATLLVEDTRLGDHLDSGVLSYLVEFLEGKKDPDFQYYSAVALETIVSKKGKEFKDTSVPYLLNLILSPEGFVKSTALDTLTEIANVFPESCDTMINEGALKHLEFLIVYEWNRGVVLESGCQLLTAFCRMKPHLLSDKMDIVVNTISTAIESQHESVLIQGCLALSLLSDRRLVKIGTGVARLLALIDYPELQIVISALRTIGNYVRWGNDEEIQSMITLSFSALIGELLRHECKILRKEACWIISNVTAVANSSQMQGIIDLGLIDMLLTRVRIDEFDVKEVAACAISNVFYGCDDNQFECIKVEYFPLLDDLRLFFDDDPWMATMCSKILELDNRYNVIKSTTNFGSRSPQNKSEEEKLSTVAISTDCSEDLDSKKPRKVRSRAPLFEELSTVTISTDC